MAKKKLVIGKGKMTFAGAANYIEKYKDGLDEKCELFVEALSKKGKQVVAQVMRNVPKEERGKYSVAVERREDGSMKSAKIILSGDKILFVEFSAGIRYGTSDYPLISGRQYGMGTYPSDVPRQNPNYPNWSNPEGWWYYDENGEPQYTFGNHAYMPMYHAEQAMVISMQKLAERIFRK